MSLQSGVTALLLDAPAVTDLVEGRVHWRRQPAHVREMPYVNAQKVSELTAFSLDGPDAIGTHRVQIDAWAETYSGAVALAQAIRDRFNGFRGTVATRYVGTFYGWFSEEPISVARFQGVFLDGERDLDGERPGKDAIYGIAQDFLIVTEELAP